MSDGRPCGLVALRHAADVPKARALMDVELQHSWVVVALSAEAHAACTRELPGRPIVWAWGAPLREELQRLFASAWREPVAADAEPLERALLFVLLIFRYELRASSAAADYLLRVHVPRRLVVFAPKVAEPIMPRPFRDPFRECALEFTLLAAGRSAGIITEHLATAAVARPAPPSVGGAWTLRAKVAARVQRVRSQFRFAWLLLTGKPFVLGCGGVVDFENMLPHLEEMEKDGIPALCLGIVSPAQLQRLGARVAGRLLHPADAGMVARWFGDTKRDDSPEDEARKLLHGFCDRHGLAKDHPVVEAQVRFFATNILPTARALRTVQRAARRGHVRSFLIANALAWDAAYFLAMASPKAQRIAIQHGGTGYVPPTGAYHGASAVGTWGDLQGELIQRSGFAGVLLSDRMPADLAAIPSLPEPSAEPFTLLLASSSQSNNTAPYVLTEEDYFRTLDALLAWAEQTPSIRLRIRCHPRFDYPEVLEEKVRGLSCVALVGGNESMADSVASAHAVVHLGSFSTLLVYAARGGRPVGVLLPEESFGVIDHLAETLLPRFRSVLELADAVRELRSSQSAGESRWRVASARFASGYTSATTRRRSVAEAVKEAFRG